MSAHPKPSDMASAAIPLSETASYRDRWEAEIRREAFADGAAAERARVAAWLRETSGLVRRAPRAEATVALLADLADELVGKPLPTATAAHACLACRRHPETHAPTGDDRCGACGLGDAREVAT